jgi:CBS domain-containing protein
MQVEDAMTRPVRTCRPGDTLVRPAQLMWEDDIGCVPVVSHEGTLLGVVTDRDICLTAARQGLRLDEIPVAVAMSRRVYSCGPTDSFEAAEAVMREHRVRRLPVVADGRVVGIVSLGDLGRAAEQEPDAHRREWLMHEVEQTFVEVVRKPALPAS